MKTSKIMILSALILLVGSIAYADSWVMKDSKTTMKSTSDFKELKANPIKVSHNQNKWKANIVRKTRINANKLPYGALVR